MDFGRILPSDRLFLSANAIFIYAAHTRVYETFGGKNIRIIFV